MTKGSLILHDNVPVPKCHIAIAALQNVGFEIWPHPPYNPDLAPNDCYLFPDLKKELRGKKFLSDEEVKEVASAYFLDKDK